MAKGRSKTKKRGAQKVNFMKPNYVGAYNKSRKPKTPRTYIGTFPQSVAKPLGTPTSPIRGNGGKGRPRPKPSPGRGGKGGAMPTRGRPTGRAVPAIQVKETRSRATDRGASITRGGVTTKAKFIGAKQ